MTLTLAIWNEGTNIPAEGITMRHGSGKNFGLGRISCLDGHMEWWTRAQWDAEVAGKPGRLCPY